MYEQLREASLSEIDALETSLPEKILKIDETLASLASSGMAEVEAKFKASVKPESANETVASMLSSARSEAATCVLNLSKYERFIGLCVPKVEDGNNFGVAVQLETRKFVAEKRQKIKELFDKCADYHKDRAALWKDIAPKSSVDTVKSQVASGEDETKDGNATSSTKKSSEKTTSESKSSVPQSILPDATASVVALDLSWYFHLYFTLESIRDAYIACGDVVNKNRQRLQQPKGDGQSAMTMF